jgi:hypothetical protein
MAVKLLEALNKRFKAIEGNKLFAEATKFNPRFKAMGFQTHGALKGRKSH